jgi:hypothetical protein
MVIGGKSTSYLRLPDDSFELLGEGPLGSDPRAVGLRIVPGGTHVFFSSQLPIAAGASPEGVRTIYDRTSAGQIQVVSQLPDGEAPGSGADVKFQGASPDGTAVAFSVLEGGVETLYERLQGEGTIAVTEGDAAFAGLSADGRLTYLKGGNAFSFDPATQSSAQIGAGGQSTPVNVSADGTHVYFVSPSALGGEPGPVAGQDNLYVWDLATESIAFIAILDHLDVVAAAGDATGLGKWTGVVGRASAADPSRTTADGSAIVFESRANLTGYDSGGHNEIYRYAVGQGLGCLSCNPTFAGATSDARLQTFYGEADKFAGTSTSTPVSNLSGDGMRAFFESGDRLVPGDNDGTRDVYEWEAQGVGGCERDGGCLSLISSGRGAANSYLYAATPSGSDALFVTPDMLTSEDPSDTYSIYDARVDGGFTDHTVSAAECLGEACQPAASVPAATTPASGAFHGQGNANSSAGRSRCPKGRHQVRRGGEVRCVRRHEGRKHSRHKRPRRSGRRASR